MLKIHSCDIAPKINSDVTRSTLGLLWETQLHMLSFAELITISKFGLFK